MSICRDRTLVKTQGPYAYAEPLRCRSWACEQCAPHRRKQLVAMAASGLPNAFITLTVNPAYGSNPKHRARMLVEAWRRLREMAISLHGDLERHRAAGTECQALACLDVHARDGRPVVDLGEHRSFPFLAVMERTRRGEPHLHILARCTWIEQRWLSRKLDQLIGAHRVWIARIRDPERCAGYVSKYCGKEPAQFGTGKRYWHSQDYEAIPYEPEWLDEEERPVWEVSKLTLRDWINERECAGWFVWETPAGATAWNVHALAQGPPTRALAHQEGSQVASW